jgi:hypothetical protein
LCQELIDWVEAQQIPGTFALDTAFTNALSNFSIIPGRGAAARVSLSYCKRHEDRAAADF